MNKVVVRLPILFTDCPSEWINFVNHVRSSEPLVSNLGVPGRTTGNSINNYLLLIVKKELQNYNGAYMEFLTPQMHKNKLYGAKLIFKEEQSLLYFRLKWG